jgi:hypothetical protein
MNSLGLSMIQRSLRIWHCWFSQALDYAHHELQVNLMPTNVYIQSFKFHHRLRDMLPLCSPSWDVVSVSPPLPVSITPTNYPSLHLHREHHRWCIMVQLCSRHACRLGWNWLRRSRVRSIHRASSKYEGCRRRLGRGAGLKDRTASRGEG